MEWTLLFTTCAVRALINRTGILTERSSSPASALGTDFEIPEFRRSPEILVVILAKDSYQEILNQGLLLIVGVSGQVVKLRARLQVLRRRGSGCPTTSALPKTLHVPPV